MGISLRRSRRQGDPPDTIDASLLVGHRVVLAARRVHEDWESLPTAEHAPVHPADRLWAECSEIVGAARGQGTHVWLDRFRVDQKGIAIDGLVRDRASVDTLASRLRKLPGVEEVLRRPVVLDRRTGWFRVGLEAVRKREE